VPDGWREGVRRVAARRRHQIGGKAAAFNGVMAGPASHRAALLEPCANGRHRRRRCREQRAQQQQQDNGKSHCHLLFFIFF
jgi:hypothetical protein